MFGSTYVRSCSSLAVILILTFGTMRSLSAQNPSTGSQPPQTDNAARKVTLEKGFEWLFDGKTLEGWEGKTEWFRIEDESIVVGSLDKNIPNNEFLCTKQSFGDFELRLQVRLKGKGDNAGIQFRSQRVPNNHEVSGYQMDVGNAWERPVWGGLYDESRRNQMLAEGPRENVPKWVRANDWNDMAVRAEGPRIRIWLNEQLTVDYTEPDATIPRTGIIGLQIHGGQPSEAWYRAIRIQKL